MKIKENVGLFRDATKTYPDRIKNACHSGMESGRMASHYYAKVHPSDLPTRLRLAFTKSELQPIANGEFARPMELDELLAFRLGVANGLDID